MADWGMRVSKPGFDVLTCVDTDLVMSSSFNTLKSYSVGTAAGTAFISHSLGYVPIYFGMNILNSVMSGIVGQNTTNDFIPMYTDANNFSIFTGTAKYYLFYQEGT